MRDLLLQCVQLCKPQSGESPAAEEKDLARAPSTYLDARCSGPLPVRPLQRCCSRETTSRTLKGSHTMPWRVCPT